MTQTAARTNHTRPRSPEMVEVSGSMITSTAAKALAVLRISTGFVFLWAFLDKTFGLNYATPSANGLFMLGLLAIGVALIAGVAMRIAAISGVVMLAMMWLAEVPFAQFTSAGEPTGSPNPFADSHYMYAIVLIVLALTYAGTTWGLGRTWARLPFVNRNRWAL